MKAAQFRRHTMGSDPKWQQHTPFECSGNPVFLQHVLTTSIKRDPVEREGAGKRKGRDVCPQPPSKNKNLAATRYTHAPGGKEKMISHHDFWDRICFSVVKRQQKQSGNLSDSAYGDFFKKAVNSW